jgi:hypothetical protein
MMNEQEYLGKIISADADAVSYSLEVKQDNDHVMDFYNCAPWNEVDGHSTVVSTDVYDVVEADMPSFARTFLGSNNPMKFEPTSANPADVQEAADKTALVDWVIRSQPSYFRMMLGWGKTALIKRFSALRYDWCEEESVTEKEYTGLDEAEAVNIKLQMLEDDQREDTDIDLVTDEQDDDGFNLKFKIKTTNSSVRLTFIPTDNFIISRNASCKEDAEIIGDDELVSKSDLIAMGFDEKTVMDLAPSSARVVNDEYNYSKNQYSDVNDPVSELVVVSTRIVKIDRDEDGIAERRKVIYCGTTLLDDEPFDHVNYALMSSILMPDEAIGKSRGEVVTKTQEVKTALVRGVLDNIYRVNSGRYVVNSQMTNIDDLLTDRPGGVVRVKGDIRQAVTRLETPYEADKTLQVIQYMDFARAQRTGTLMASQGLSQDNLYNETATRFEGVQDEGGAKTELVLRTMAETGFKELYEGIAWTLAHYQDSKMEIEVLGKQLVVDPSKWRFNHLVSTMAGTGASDEEVTANTTALLTIANQLKTQGSVLVDDMKIYNMLDRAVKAMGVRDTSVYFNNPEIPEETMRAQYEQLLSLAEQQKMALEQQNPLAQAEQIKAQASLLNTQIKEQTAQQKNELELLKLRQEQQQFNMEAVLEAENNAKELALKLTDLEMKYQRELSKNVEQNVMTFDPRTGDFV